MDLFAKRMASTVEEVVAESFFADITPCRIVHLESVDGFIAGNRRLDALHRPIASRAYYIENILERGGRVQAAITRPGYVVENCMRPIELCPQIDKYGILVPDLPAALRRRLVVGIRHIGIDGYDWAVVRHQPGPRELLPYQAVHIPFGDRCPGSEAGCNLFERRRPHAVHQAAGRELTFT